MKAQLRKRHTLLVFGLLVVGGCALAFALWIRAEQRQYQLNRDLIKALHQGEIKRALALVESGADPNTRFIPLPPPTWTELLNQLVKHSAPPSNNSPTAFMIVCGDTYRQERHILLSIILENHIHDPHMMQLALVMIAHGANVNTRDEMLESALMYAALYGLTDQMDLLIKHGAAIDSQDILGFCALHRAVEQNHQAAVKLLLKYHANPNLRSRGMPRDRTPLTFALERKASPEIIRLLKAAGAK